MKALPQRVISALIAAALLICTGYFGGKDGLSILGAVIFSIGAYEFSQMAFKAHLPKASERGYKLLFLLFAFVMLYVSIATAFIEFTPNSLLALWASAIAAYISSTLWLARSRIDNSALIVLICTSVLGLFYCALLPSFVVRLIYVESGLAWFALLALVVFAGDTFAFFGGIALGKNKLMPSLSPSKTIAGSVSGLVGSAAAGLTVGHLWLSDIPVFYLIFTAIIAGALAQNGDLFESLIKRVATVKDSGRIMPGHGGVLDRLDGIYFAAPVIFAAALLLNP